MSDEVPELSPEAKQVTTAWDTMPKELADLLEDRIEPYTIKFEIEHSDVMQIFKKMWPFMQGWMVHRLMGQLDQLDLEETE